jgi:antitoxin CptB
METRKKRLQLRAWRRGTRELDLIIGTVIDRMIETMNEQQLGQMEALLEEEDLETYDWIIGREPTPPEHDHEMMAELQDFARLASKVQQGLST